VTAAPKATSEQNAQRPWVVIQRNPTSGTGWRRSLLVELVQELRRLGLRPRMFHNRSRCDRWLAVPEHQRQTLCLVAAGGDGTVDDLLNRHPGWPLAILPLGTENLLARGLGISPSGRDLAQLIAGGRQQTIDLGIAGVRRFALMASIGFDAEVIHRVHAGRTGTITHLSYLQPIWAALRTYQHPRLKVWLDDELQAREARLAVVVNYPMYALNLPMARAARADDGWLEVRLFQRGSAFQILRYFCTLVFGRHEQLADVISIRARRVRIECDDAAPVQLDGDPHGTTPVEIQIIPGALRVFAPAPVDNSSLENPGLGNPGPGPQTLPTIPTSGS